MKGYINIFEGECMFIGKRAYAMHKGMQVTILSEIHKGEKAVLGCVEGRWVLKGSDFEILHVQGVEVFIESSQLA